MSEQKLRSAGASRGIGKAIAEQLMADGYLVCGTATTESGAANIDAWINGAGLAMNVTEPARRRGLGTGGRAVRPGRCVGE